MQNLTTDDLDTVTGGTAGGISGSATPAPISSSTSASSGTSNDALLTSLNSISSSIKDLSNHHNNGLFGGNGMLMLGMALAMRRQSEVVVYGGRHGGYYWRASW